MIKPTRIIDIDQGLPLLGMERDSHFPVTREELYNLQMDIKHVQIVQGNHAERLSKLEKRQSDDAAIKSVWNSPFPTILGGTPQQGPVQLPSQMMLSSLDEQGHFLGSLHLGPAEEEPVRRGAASRANSVRFDESALQGSSWAVGSNHNRHSGDFASVRPGGGLLMERSSSHKSDGRHSSTGQSVYSHHSVASGRASSLDTGFPTGIVSRDRADSPVDFVEPPPGLFALGSVPAIIRCWLSTDFRSNTLLYAIVCTGAQRSTIDGSLLRGLDLLDDVQRDTDGAYRIRLPIYLAEAVPRPVNSSRSRSPTPVPSIIADLEVTGLDQSDDLDSSGPGIHIFLGSDTLRLHSADILFSRNQMSVHTCDRTKFMVPFVRPEDDGLYRSIITAKVAPGRPRLNANATPFVSGGDTRLLYDRQGSLTPDEPSSAIVYCGDADGDSDVDAETDSSPIYDTEQRGMTSPIQNQVRQVGLVKACDVKMATEADIVDIDKPRPMEGAAMPDLVTAKVETGLSEDLAGRPFGGSSGTESGSTDNRRELTTGIWGSWRHGGASGPIGSGSARENSPLSGYQPAGRGRNMKVLRPQKSSSAVSAKTAVAYEPVTTPRVLSGILAAGGGGRGASLTESSSVNGALSGGNNDQPRQNQEGLVGGERPSSSPLTPSSVTASGPGESRREQKGNGIGSAPYSLPLSLPSLPLPPTSSHESKDSRRPREDGRPSNPIGGASAFSWMKIKTQTATAQ